MNTPSGRKRYCLQGPFEHCKLKRAHFDFESLFQSLAIDSNISRDLINTIERYGMSDQIYNLIEFLKGEDVSRILSDIPHVDNLKNKLAFISKCSYHWKELVGIIQTETQLPLTPSRLVQLTLEASLDTLRSDSITQIANVLIDLHNLNSMRTFETKISIHSAEINTFRCLVGLSFLKGVKNFSKLSDRVWIDLLKITTDNENKIVPITLILFTFVAGKAQNVGTLGGSRLLISAVQRILGNVTADTQITMDDAFVTKITGLTFKYREVIEMFPDELLSVIGLSPDIYQDELFWPSLLSMSTSVNLRNLNSPSQVRMFRLVSQSLSKLFTVGFTRRLTFEKNIFSKVLVQDKPVDDHLRFFEALAFLFDSEAENVLSRLDSILDDRKFIVLYDMLNSVRLLGTNNFLFLDSVQIPPLKEDEFYQIAYPELMGLRGPKVKGPLVKDMYVYIRPCVKECYEELSKLLLSGAKYIELHGPPGIGKSTSIAYWAQLVASTGVSVCWISLSEAPMIFIMMPSTLCSVRVNTNQVIDILNSSSLCDINAADQNRTKVIFCTSDGQLDIKGADSITLDGWTLNEYRFVSRNLAFISPFLDLLSHDEELISSPALKDAICEKEGVEDALKELIDEKFFFAGGNARFFFAFDTAYIKLTIEKCLRRMCGSVQEEALKAVNIKIVDSIFTRVNSTVSDFVSKFAAQLFVELQFDNYAKGMWNYTQHLTNSALGAVFQFLSEKQIKLKRKFIVLKEGDHLEELIVDDFSQYYFARVKSIGRALRAALQAGHVMRTDQGFVFRSEEDKFFKTLSNLNKHLPSEPTSFKPDAQMFQRYALQVVSGRDLEALELIDVRRSNFWILTSRVNEPVIDMIRIVSETEAWLIQLTIAETHEISDYKYINDLRSILKEWLPGVELTFAVIVPKNRRFCYSDEQKKILAAMGVTSTWYSINDGPLAALHID